MSVVDGMDIHCEICECNIRKSGWAKHVKDKRHVDGTLQIEKKHCWKCGCFKVLEGFAENHATCHVRLAQRKRWRDKTPDKVRDGQRIGKK